MMANGVRYFLMRTIQRTDDGNIKEGSSRLRRTEEDGSVHVHKKVRCVFYRNAPIS